MTTETREGVGGFLRRYAKSWQHALATAALTAIGTLTFVHQLFAVLAIVAYLLPPVVLYVRDKPLESKTDTDRSADQTATDDTDRSDDQATTDDAAAPTWTAATVPTDETLRDVAFDGETAYAVGENGSVLAGADGDWSVVLSDGPGANGNALTGVDATGGAVWFAGESGAVGRLEAGSGRHVDLSAPAGDTNNIVAVAVSDTRAGETVLLADGSGQVRRGQFHDGSVSWDDPVKPGSGSSIAALTASGTTGYACDTNQCVFVTRDGGRTFESMALDGVDGQLTDVAATQADAVAVSTDDGVIHRFDGQRWTPQRLCDEPLQALALEKRRGLAAGGRGSIYEQAADSQEWETVATPATGSLRGVALAPSSAVAVGEDGTVVERASSSAAASSD